MLIITEALNKLICPCSITSVTPRLSEELEEDSPLLLVPEVSAELQLALTRLINDICTEHTCRIYLFLYFKY